MKHGLLLFKSFVPSLIKFPVIGFAALAVFFFGSAPQTQHPYAGVSGLTAIDVPGAGTTANALQGTTAFGINATGAIVGLETDSAGVHHGYVRGADGTITKFDAPGAGTNTDGGTLAVGINAGGDTTGSYKDSANVFHGFVRSASGAITQFDVPDATTRDSNQGTTAFGINATGDVTGYYTQFNATNYSYVSHGFLRAADGTFTTFDAPSAGSSELINNEGTRPIAINDAGTIAGLVKDTNGVFHGFVRAANGSITNFDAPNAGTGKAQGTLASAIDASGDITGLDVDTNGTSHGFLRAANGTFTTFDATGAGTGLYQGTFPLAINSAGTIVGANFDAKYVLHGFERTADGTLTTIDAPNAGSGMNTSGNQQSFQGTGAFGINASGVITGSYLDSSSVTHGFVIAAPAAVPASFTVTGTAVSVNPGATTGNTSTITVTPAGGFTGAVALTASVTGPTGASDPPTLNFGTTTPVAITGTSAGTATLTISTTAASSASLLHPGHRELRWYGAGGAVLACVLFFGVPARRRGWMRLLSLLLFFAAIGGVILGCSGSGGSTSTGPTQPANPGTTPGNYTITVTGTSGSTTSTGTVALTVQ